MTIARHYVMVSSASKTQELKAALIVLAAKVEGIRGCEGVALFQDSATPTRFTFVEYWASVAAHKDGGALLGKDALTHVLATLAVPPEATYLEKIAT